MSINRVLRTGIKVESGAPWKRRCIRLQDIVQAHEIIDSMDGKEFSAGRRKGLLYVAAIDRGYQLAGYSDVSDLYIKRDVVGLTDAQSFVSAGKRLQGYSGLFLGFLDDGLGHDHEDYKAIIPW